MKAENYNVIGVMSGTSLDGIDLAHISLTFSNEKWHYSIKEADTIPYPELWIQTLKAAVDYNDAQLQQLNLEYTHLLSMVIDEFIAKYNLGGIDAVCSHGHTILHQPHNGFTLQIGNLPMIARLTGQTVICDFRVDDVKLGGQGAPLVPIGDRMLFSGYDHCLNLGGFSNISFEENGKRIAYDICAVNTVLNHYAALLGMDYDAGGANAAKGETIYELLAELNSLEFYTLPYPKSLGFEFVKMVILPLMELFEGSPEDKLRTFTEHIAQQLAKALGQNTGASVLVTGGGAYNTFLINMLKELLPQVSITIPDDKTIQYKEALIFALLGVLKLRNEINVLSSVTGATHDHSSGKIYNP